MPDSHSQRPRERRESGFALVEAAVVLVAIAIAMLANVSWTVSGVSLSADNRETVAAHDALRRIFEELQEVPFEEVFARFNRLPEDDPDGANTALGGTFGVEPGRKEDFLRQDASVATSTSIAYRHCPLNVEVSFPVNHQGRLSEIAVDTDWCSRTWDLDGDGSVEDGDVSSSYGLLPIRVRISWSGARGARSIEHVRLLKRRLRADATE